MNEQQQPKGASFANLLKWVPSFLRLGNLLTSPRGLAGGIVAIVALYLGYDILKGRVSPCESLYEQASVGVKTRIHFLENEAELEIGKAALMELDDRGQMAALNLKTCCTVLDAGRIDPEQFLQCKAKARAYDDEIAAIVALVKTAVADASSKPAPTMTSGPETVTTGSIPGGASDAQLGKALEAKVDAARTISQEFNKQVVEVRKEQALATLAATPVAHIDIAAEEREPNDNLLSSNVLALDTWVTGAINAAKDADYYSFVAPEGPRDWLAIEFKNQSTTVEPRLELFDGEKTSQGVGHKTTAGADLVYRLVAVPGGRYTVRVSNYYGESQGVYALRVAATKAYDSFEPNDGILAAKPVEAGEPIRASIMDRRDADFFSFSVGEGEQTFAVKLENRSTTLHPKISVFDGAKSEIGTAHNTTTGGEARYAWTAKGPATYFVRVSDYYSDGAGDYTLIVSETTP